MSINSLCWCLRPDDVLKRMIMSGNDLEKLTKRPAPLDLGAPLVHAPRLLLNLNKRAPDANSKTSGWGIVFDKAG